MNEIQEARQRIAAKDAHDNQQTEQSALVRQLHSAVRNSQHDEGVDWLAGLALVSFGLPLLVLLWWGTLYVVGVV